MPGNGDSLSKEYWTAWLYFLCHCTTQLIAFNSLYIWHLFKTFSSLKMPVRAPQVVLVIKNPSANARYLGWIPGLRRSPAEGNGNLLSILAWKTPWTEEHGRLESMELQRVRHNWATGDSHISIPVEQEDKIRHWWTTHHLVTQSLAAELQRWYSCFNRALWHSFWSYQC